MSQPEPTQALVAQPASNLARQYVQVCFQKYTYHNDGLPVAVGDKVTVLTKDGPKEVEVVGLCEKPDFATKPIVPIEHTLSKEDEFHHGRPVQR